MITKADLEQFYIILNEDFSGGAKLTELTVKLVEIGWNNVKIMDLEQAIKNDSNCGLGVLNYYFPASNREKTFIYIKLTDDQE